MPCKLCTSENQRKFTAETAVHFSGLKNLDQPTVFVFSRLLVCMDCGLAEFAVPETELFLLRKDPAAWRTTSSPTQGVSIDLSEFVALPLSTGEIDVPECAAHKPLAPQNGFYRH